MVVGWNYPSNGGGVIRGKSDPGIETFKDKEITSLAREVCQNSLDAKDDKVNDCVCVEFEKYKIFTKDIPGYNEYKEKIKKAKSYWVDNKNTSDFLNDMEEAINRTYTSVLRISDYNTVGLESPYKLCNKGWITLTRMDGGATKTDDKAGSFGIGKNAPFANSVFRLVFYRTLNMDNERAAQGVSRFVSFPEDERDINRTMTSGIGYYGDTEYNFPIQSIELLEKLNKRDRKGTDVFVYGFKEHDNWEDEIIVELLDNFLISIFKNKLAVSVNGIKINSNTLDEIIEKYKIKAKNAYNFYRVLVSNDSMERTYEFHNMGQLKLKVLMSPKEKLNRKVLVTRTSGMKVLIQDRISRTISFSGYLELVGNKINKFFRELENPAHDKWVASRYEENPKLADEYIKEVRDWVKNTILNMGETKIEDEMLVEGLNGVLLKDSVNDADENKNDIFGDKINNIIFEKKKDIEDIRKREKVKGSLDGGSRTSWSDNGGKGFGDGNGKRTTTRTGKIDPQGKDMVDGDILYKKQIYPDKIRVIKIGSQTYRISICVPFDIEKGYIEVKSIGENGNYAIINILNAISKKNCETIYLKNNKMYFSGIKKNEKTIIEFSIPNEKNYAMEVDIYEN